MVHGPVNIIYDHGVGLTLDAYIKNLFGDACTDAVLKELKQLHE